MEGKSPTSCWRKVESSLRILERETSTFTTRYRTGGSLLRTTACTTQSTTACVTTCTPSCCKTLQLRLVCFLTVTFDPCPQLLNGASNEQRENLGVTTPDYYSYLNQSGTYTVEDVNDEKEFSDTMVSNVKMATLRAPKSLPLVAGCSRVCPPCGEKAKAESSHLISVSVQCQFGLVLIHY